MPAASDLADRLATFERRLRAVERTGQLSRSSVTTSSGDVLLLPDAVERGVAAEATAAAAAEEAAAAAARAEEVNSLAAQAAADASAAASDADAAVTAANSASSTAGAIDSRTSGWVAADGVSVDGGVLYADSVGAGAIAADAILARHIKAGEITAGKMATGTITAASGVIGSIDAATITVGKITAAQLATGTITAASGVIGSIDAAKITVGTIKGTQLAADAIDGKTITGATIRTAATGARWVLGTSTLLNTLQAYTGRTGEISPAGIKADVNTGGIWLEGSDFGAGKGYIALGNAFYPDGYKRTLVEMSAGTASVNGTEGAMLTSGATGVYVTGTNYSGAGLIFPKVGAFVQADVSTAAEIRSDVGVGFTAGDGRLSLDTGTVKSNRTLVLGSTTDTRQVFVQQLKQDGASADAIDVRSYIASTGATYAAGVMRKNGTIVSELWLYEGNNMRLGGRAVPVLPGGSSKRFVWGEPVTVTTDSSGYATISHGLGITPSTYYAVQAGSSGSSALLFISITGSATSSTFRVRCFLASTGAVFVGAVALSFFAGE